MQGQSNQLQETINSFNFPYQELLGQKYKLQKQQKNQEKSKKKNKKQVQEGDSLQSASQKVTRMLQQLSKNYQTAAKSFNKIKQLKNSVDQAQKDRDFTIKGKQNLLNLSKVFKARYDEELRKAQQVEKQEEAKRKQIIEELQERIKTIQTNYEEAGRNKVQKYRQNQTLKHQTSKLQPHLIASQSLYQAQLKKKAIQIQIQMTTLKQKIEMMDSFKGMKTETIQKVQKATVQQQKINNRLKKITDKQDQHKILLAKAHLVFEDYKKAINTLKNVLPKRQKQAHQSKLKAAKAENSLKQLRKQLNDLELQIQNQIKQKQVLQTLEGNLIKQTEQAK